MAKRGGERKSKARKAEASEYRHTQAASPLRPDVGTQAQFRKKKPPAKYRYDSSLAPALDWDAQNPAREQGEARIAQLQAEIAAVRALKPPSPLAGEGGKAVAFVFGPENGALSDKLVYEGVRETHAKGYAHLYVIGFAIQPNARKLVEECEAAVGVPATYVQATPDLVMGDLLKNMRSSQIFSVCGLPEVALRKDGAPRYQVELLGLDVFDPVTMETTPLQGDDVPAWLLDTDYNNLAFHVCQEFFPRTSAWASLKRALRGAYEESVWDHLSGTVSAPFEAGKHGQIAVKGIDGRGNELLMVKQLEEVTT